MQLHSTNTLPFSTQRDNPVLTKKKGERQKKRHTLIENPPERVKEEEQREGWELGRREGKLWTLADAKDKLYLI